MDSQKPEQETDGGNDDQRPARDVDRVGRAPVEQRIERFLQPTRRPKDALRVLTVFGGEVRRRDLDRGTGTDKYTFDPARETQVNCENLLRA
jgi:hypothetical protein